jgi:hypothetical protein
MITIKKENIISENSVIATYSPTYGNPKNILGFREGDWSKTLHAIMQYGDKEYIDYAVMGNYMVDGKMVSEYLYYGIMISDAIEVYNKILNKEDIVERVRERDNKK